MLISIGMAGMITCACQPSSISPIDVFPSSTPFPFVTATQVPTGTPITPTATTTPLPTVPPTATYTSGLILTPSTPTQGGEVTPTIGQVFCPSQPAGVFRYVYDSTPGLPIVLGCVSTPDEDTAAQPWPVEARYLPMERGHMLWLSSVGWYEGRVIYVMLDDQSYTRYDDTYISGVDNRSGGPSPPEGLFQPVENLGKVWRIVPGLIERVGFGIEPETQGQVVMQLYQYGEMVHLPDRGEVFVLWRSQPDGWALYKLGAPASDEPP